MKNMGEASYVLGARIIRNHSKKLLGLSQENYIEKILNCFQMNNSKLIDTPFEKYVSYPKDYKETDEEKNGMNKVPYANGMRSLINALLCIRLDISLLLEISRLQSNSGLCSLTSS